MIVVPALLGGEHHHSLHLGLAGKLLIAMHSPYTKQTRRCLCAHPPKERALVWQPPWRRSLGFACCALCGEEHTRSDVERMSYIDHKSRSKTHIANESCKWVPTLLETVKKISNIIYTSIYWRTFSVFAHLWPALIAERCVYMWSSLLGFKSIRFNQWIFF